jgi:hypothetical protein
MNVFWFFFSKKNRKPGLLLKKEAKTLYHKDRAGLGDRLRALATDDVAEIFLAMRRSCW